MIPYQPPEPLEREVRNRVTKLYLKVGCKVSNLDQGYRPGGKRHGTTRQRKGLADLYVTHPQFGVLWHELKKQDGVQSVDQQEFQQEQQELGDRVHYVLGGHYEALTFLIEVGLWRLPAGVSPEQVSTPTRVRKQSAIDARRQAKASRRSSSPGSSRLSSAAT